MLGAHALDPLAALGGFAIRRKAALNVLRIFWFAFSGVEEFGSRSVLVAADVAGVMICAHDSGVGKCGRVVCR